VRATSTASSRDAASRITIRRQSGGGLCSFRPACRLPYLSAALAAAGAHACRAAGGAEATGDPGLLNRNIVLQNSVIFGSVNANRYHYELAAEALAQADSGRLADLITRQVPLDQWEDAYAHRPDDIKAVLTLADA